MHDLRKQVLLESGKTVSRKARSKAGTPSSSRNVSHVRSNTASRNVSDDEDGMSDTTQLSSQGIEELPVEDDANPGAWVADLADRINEICDRKRSSVQGREEALLHFNTYLTRHYALDQISTKMDELVPAILKSVKSGQSERETVLALRAVALMLITKPSETLYDDVADTIKHVIQDALYSSAKVAAINALSVATFYGGASPEETEATMDLFLEIVTSDGAKVDEADNADVVIAALEEWGFLATQLEDMEEATEAAMEFVDQLDSANANVQIAAGDNIALMFEKSYTEIESDEEEDDSDEDQEINQDGERMLKRYTVYRQHHQLKQQLAELSKASSKRLSKKDKKNLHMTFTDILHTVEKPTRGPRYSTALDENGNELGSRLKVATPGGGRMTVDKWWKLHRLNALRRLLQGGFLEHHENNEVVFDSLPVMIEN